MTEVTLTPDILGALYDTAVASVNGVTVLDGPGVTDTSGPVLWVGWDSFNQESSKEAQDWAEVGSNYGAAREATVDVACSVWAQDGDGSQAAARGTAKVILDAFGGALRAAPTLGLVFVQGAQVTSLTWRQDQVAGHGAVCHVGFTVQIITRH